MFSKARTALAIGALITAPLAAAGCGGSDDDGGAEVPATAVASIDGTAIPVADLDHTATVAAKLARASGQGAVPDPPSYARCTAELRRQASLGGLRTQPSRATLVAQCRRLEDGFRRQALAQVIQLAWFEGEAEELGVEIGESDLVRARRAAFARPAELTRFLRTAGLSQDELDEQLRFNLYGQEITEAVQRRGAEAPTDAEISAYYARNREQFAVPERRDLELVLTRTEAQANQARRAIESGTPWAQVARRLSTDALSKGNGGRLAGVARGQQDRALDAAAFGARVDELVGPVRGQFGWYVVRVTRIAPARQSSLEDSRAQIRELLLQEGRARALDDFARAFQERWTERTQCRAGYVIEICANAPRRATSTAGGTVATTPADQR